MSNIDGSWDSLQNWPLIGIHAIVTGDGNVLTFGTDSRGMQSGEFIYDVYDPVTGEHTTLPNNTPTDIFCSAAIVLPGTSQILIGGGDARPLGSVNRGVNDVNIFDSDDLSLTPAVEGDMNFQRWYPTLVSLSSGQVVIIGGTDINGRGVATPEIFTPGEGWRKLDGATDTDLGASPLYARSFVNESGEIVYFATARGNDSQIEVMSLDPSGNGSLEQIGTLPFTYSWDQPAIMYETGKILIQAPNGQLWIMDINGATPSFTQTTSLNQMRDWSDMTVLADGTVLINGGSAVANQLNNVDTTAAIWDPDSGQITYGADEDLARLYHSATVLLPDGSLLAVGGGAPGPLTNLNGQTYKPPYLYDDNGNLADRPVITDAPDAVHPGDTFTITLDDASAINKLTFVKTGAVTHSLNMEGRSLDLDFAINPANPNQLLVTLPENAHEVGAGNWMLFAWDGDGVPSIAPILSVDPTLPLFDGTGDVTAEYFLIDAATASLDTIDFTQNAVHTEQVGEINETGTGSFYAGGPTDNFAVKYSGQFMVGEGGNFTFYLTSDDGARLLIDGVEIIDNDGLHAAVEETANVNLTNGLHDIEVLYFEAAGASVLDLDWAGPGFAREQMQFDGAQENLLVNGSLELASIDDGDSQIGTAPVGWTAGDNVEVWANGENGVTATSGKTFVEIDNLTGPLSQSFQSQAGQAYALAFDLSGRPGFVASSAVDVVFNGTVVQTITPDDANWERYSVDLIGTGGNDTVEFRAVNGDTDFYGALLDAVILQATDSPPTGDGDRFEANDNFANATILDTATQNTTYNNLTIHEAGNDDYYRLTAPTTGTLNVSLDFAHAQGDVDIIIYDANQNIVSIGGSGDDNENVNVTVVEGQDYYLHVYGYNGATNEYSMTVELPDPNNPGPVGDRFEPNDAFATAAQITDTSATLTDLSIHVPDNGDYYTFTATGSGIARVDLTFPHAQGDVDVLVFDANQNQLVVGGSGDDNESVSFNAIDGQNYYIWVYGYNGATNDYTMNITQPTGPVQPGDRFEENDSFETATTLTNTNSLYADLSIEQPNDGDYYKFTAQNDGTANVDLTFSHANGDVDVIAYDRQGNQIVIGGSGDDNESINFDVARGEDYVLWVYGYNGAVNEYDMELDLAPEPSTV